MTQAILELEQFSIAIAEQNLCENLTVRIKQGESWALLGRNGAGKTSLLHSILALHEYWSGKISIKGQEIKNIARRELAKQVGMLFQDGISTLPSTVLETALLGRHPHSQSILRDSSEDIAATRQILNRLDLDTLENRQVDTLSGGEKQRLALAMLMTQAPALYLLDEPSNHLDLAFQVKLLALLQTEVKQQNASLLMATHDINLASRFCDHVILMSGDGKCITGTCEEVLEPSLLTAAYGCNIRSISEGDKTFYYPD